VADPALLTGEARKDWLWGGASPSYSGVWGPDFLNVYAGNGACCIHFLWLDADFEVCFHTVQVKGLCGARAQNPILIFSVGL